MEVIYTATRLGSQVNIKDPIPKRHNHNTIYHTVCPQDNCNEDYIGEFARRLTAQKMKFSTKLVTFTEEILNGKLHFFVQEHSKIELKIMKFQNQTSK